MTSDLFGPEPPAIDLTPIRGGGPVGLHEGRRKAAGMGGRLIPFLNAHIPEPLLARGMTIQAGQGYGKTLLCTALLAATYFRRAAEPGHRAKLICVDVKGDLTPRLLAMNNALATPSPVYLLNPFDRFARAIDPHAFTRDPTQITRLVASLTWRRRDARSDDFFDSAARQYLVALVKVLHTRAGGAWTWRDLYLLATDYRLLKRVLRHSKLGRKKTRSIVRKTFAGVVNTIESWLDQYEAAFACMTLSPPFDLDRFLARSGIAILTCPEDQLDSLLPLVRTVLRQVKDRVLTDAEGASDGRITLLLDEFAYLDNCAEVIEPLFGRARSSRCEVLTTWQSFPAAAAAHTEPRMRGIVDNAAVRFWMGCGAESAEVAAKDCQTGEVLRRDRSRTSGDDRPSSLTVADRLDQRRHVLPAEIQSLPPPTPSDLTLRGYLCGGFLGGPLYCEQDMGRFVGWLNA